MSPSTLTFSKKSPYTLTCSSFHPYKDFFEKFFEHIPVSDFRKHLRPRGHFPKYLRPHGILPKRSPFSFSKISLSSISRGIIREKSFLTREHFQKRLHRAQRVLENISTGTRIFEIFLRPRKRILKLQAVLELRRGCVPQNPAQVENIVRRMS